MAAGVLMEAREYDFGLTRENLDFALKIHPHDAQRKLDFAHAIDVEAIPAHHCPMAHAFSTLADGRVRVVGSIAGRADLQGILPAVAAECCDMVEIRLDLLCKDTPGVDAGMWRHLGNMPLLFTARRGDEGGCGDLPAGRRMELLEHALDDAACIDLEVASIPDMGGLLESLQSRGIPWIASFHDFTQLPETAVLDAAARRARDAGATLFKAAAMLHGPADMARLADFQLADHGIPVATMGMGPLAPVSRLLCAQCGSALNYGYLGETPTAPGQWDAAFLKQAIERLARFEG
jgi:3-dehydroquinate dehydratase I